MKSIQDMDIVKGNLDDISRPASGSRSRPGSRILSIPQGEKPKLYSNVGSLEVLTPEMCMLEKLTSCDGQETLTVQGPESSLEDPSSQSSTVITQNSELESVNENLKSREAEQSDSTALAFGSEHNIDPRLEKAIRRMKALDEILLKRIAEEEKVVAQSNAVKKKLWEELQSVSKHSLPYNHKESINTNSFLALTPQFDNTTGGTSDFDMFLPVFSTELLLEECDETKALQGKAPGMKTSEVLNSSERLHRRTKQKKYKGVDFIQKNVELVKKAGSHVLFMDDEKLRLEELLADISDDCSDDDFTTDGSLWLVPSEGYTPESGERTQLAKIEAQLQMIYRATETSDCVSPKTAKTAYTVQDEEGSDEVAFLGCICEARTVSPLPKKEVSLVKFGNAVTAPGERVLCYTKELREQKIRLKEIEQQLENIERSSTMLSI